MNKMDDDTSELPAPLSTPPAVARKQKPPILLRITSRIIMFIPHAFHVRHNDGDAYTTAKGNFYTMIYDVAKQDQREAHKGFISIVVGGIDIAIWFSAIGKQRPHS